MGNHLQISREGVMAVSISPVRRLRAGRALGLLSAVMVAVTLGACGGQDTPVNTNVGASPQPNATTPSSAASSAPSGPPPVDCAVAKCIALTFDDGPSQYTPKLLDTFEANDSRATLFMLGKAASLHPQIVRRAYDQGFEIANHTTDHKMLNSISADQVEFQISDTQKRLYEITGVYPNLLRPPYAGRNKTSDAISGKNGLAVIIWTDSPSDWINKNTETVTKLTLERARPGIIMLFHDTKEWTVNAMTTVVPKLKEQGYSLVTVTQLLGKTEPGKVYP